MDRLFDEVLVRPPGETYKDCLSKNPLKDTIDPKKALEQHKDYAKLLEKNGVEVEELSPLEAYPDSIFLQDTAFIGKNSNTAVIC
ncbi:MAG: amidinotransferase, partial [Candidatus Thermoplasmatota archaeon]